MEVELIKTFRFDAAHSLSAAPEGHKCRRLHGHGYRVDIHVTGPVDSKRGWLMDYGDLKAVVGPILDELDHRNLDEIPELKNSTSERLAGYIWDRIQPSLPNLSAIILWESDSSRCVYRGK
jgi:6-pyruvoyltetrahydropterin/6-carboxytetrahydropterin synthase